MNPEKNIFVYHCWNTFDKPKANSPLSRLCFLDWLERLHSDNPPWYTVAYSQKVGSDTCAIFSALARVGPNVIDRVLIDTAWQVDLNIGYPSFWSHGDENYIYDDGRTEIHNDVVYEPFVIYHSKDPNNPPTFEFIQEFCLYHKVFKKMEAGKSILVRIDEAGDEHPVARTYQENDAIIVEVDRHHLRDFLAARECLLIRFHDKITHSDSWDDCWLSGERNRRFQHREGHQVYSVSIGKSVIAVGGFGRLLGKEILLPYKEPNPRHWNGDEEKYQTFIYKRDNNGQLLEASCDQEDSSSEPGFLTPIYFKKEILTRYYAEPSKYIIDTGSLSRKGAWMIPIDCNDEGLIQVWLGDLAQLPYSQQLIWRGFNVEPRGGITQGRYLRDIEAQWAEPDNDPIFYFKQAFEKVNKIIINVLGKALFKELNERDKHIIQTIRIPVTEEWREFEEIIHSLAKLLVESLDVAQLTDLSQKKIDNKKFKGSLDLLEHWLKQIAPDNYQTIIGPFRMIQNLRSTGAAHLKGENFEKALTRWNLQNITNSERFAKVIVDITESLNILSSELTS